MTDSGSFPLSSAGDLPNVTVAFPGEHWSDGKASGAITPGSLIVPAASAGQRYWAVAASGTLDPRSAVALRTVQIPDVNTGPSSDGPNEIMNTEIASGEYVHAYRSGAFHLTLVKPSATDYLIPGTLIGWDELAARPAGKTGVGSWKKVTNSAHALFEVHEWRPLTPGDDEGVLTVRSLRSQF